MKKKKEKIEGKNPLLEPDPNEPVSRYEQYLEKLAKQEKNVLKVYKKALQYVDKADNVKDDLKPFYVSVALKAADNISNRLHGKPVEHVDVQGEIKVGISPREEIERRITGIIAKQAKGKDTQEPE